ncbi:hypothetical protein EH802P2_00085 [Enterococcus phage EH802P2]|nr:hypothetical protein EH802P1_00014 [Enterococcus phage EH802P1]WAX16190.1 hypothetical protein EH802P2_00085 [Enterococcus phage EH802P2]
MSNRQFVYVIYSERQADFLGKTRDGEVFIEDVAIGAGDPASRITFLKKLYGNNLPKEVTDEVTLIESFKQPTSTITQAEYDFCMGYVHKITKECHVASPFDERYIEVMTLPEYTALLELQLNYAKNRAERAYREASDYIATKHEEALRELTAGNDYGTHSA